MNELTSTSLPLEAIRAFCARHPIKHLSLFGSALRDELKPESDIDLLVEYVPDARISYFDMAQQEIDLSQIIGRRVDLRTPQELSRYFRQQVIESARLVYEKSPENTTYCRTAANNLSG